MSEPRFRRSSWGGRDVSTTFAELRQDISTEIAAIGGAWNASPVPFALHGPDDVPDAVPRSKAHLSFAIGLESLGSDDRQKLANGAHTTTIATVRFFARFTPADGITSEDAGLDAEHALIKAVVATATDFQILWSSSTRSMVSTGEWFVHEVAFTAYHRLPLQ